MLFFLIILSTIGFWSLIGYYWTQQLVPTVDLREKLKNLSKDTEGLVQEIEVSLEKKKKISIDYRKIMSQFFGAVYMEKLERDLTQCDIPMKAGEFLMLRLWVVILGGLGVLIYSGSLVYTLGTIGFLSIIHAPIMKIKRSMRITKFVNQLAEFLVLITNSLRAGQTFIQGVDIASKESPNPIGYEFRYMLKETNLGLPVEQALNNMLERMPSDDLKIVLSAFAIQRNVGGNLADIMEQVAAMIRQRIQIQGQIRVLTTQGKLSGAIVGLLPVVLGAFLSTINYPYMSKLWTVGANGSWMGPMALGGGILLQLLGCFVIYKICDIEV